MSYTPPHPRSGFEWFTLPFWTPLEPNRLKNELFSMSDHPDLIDPELDTVTSEPNPVPTPRSLLSFFGGTSRESSNTSAQESLPKKRATRTKKSDTADAKQTRLGAGLKPVIVQPEPEPLETLDIEAGPITTENVPLKAASKITRKRTKKENDEDAEFKEMAKSTKKKGKAVKKDLAGSEVETNGEIDKPAQARKRKKKGVDDSAMVLELDNDDSVLSENPSSSSKSTAKKRKSTANNSKLKPGENDPTPILIPESPISRPTIVQKKRKLDPNPSSTHPQPNGANDPMIIMDSSFDDDDGIEFVNHQPTSSSGSSGFKKPLNPIGLGVGKKAHPFFGPKPPIIDEPANLEPRESIDLESASVHEQADRMELPTTPRPQKKGQAHPDRVTHDFFQFKPKQVNGSDDRNLAEPIGKGSNLFQEPKEVLVGKPGWGRDKEDKVRSARWPCAEEQHVWGNVSGEEGLGSVFKRRSLDLPRRERKRSLRERNEDDGFWKRVYPREENFVRKMERKGHDGEEKRVKVVDTAITEHPAITCLAEKKKREVTGSNKLWTDKYRPMNSSQVLGNEIPSKYLTDWLKELTLGREERHVPGGSNRPDTNVTPKKRKILRKVKRERKRKVREDDWIVDDTLDPIQDYLSADGTDSTGSVTDDENQKDLSSGVSVYPPFSARLSNSILLQGPHGCGKTAAVYAAASELGWEVFEVNPGTKRSGAQLSLMVGEVGKNHMVGRAGHGHHQQEPPAASVVPKKAKEEKKSALMQAFKRVAGGGSGSSSRGSSRERPDPADEKSGSSGSTGSPIDLERPGSVSEGEGGFGFLAPLPDRDRPHDPDSNSNSNPNQHQIRQSLILFEEVDILYEEDQGFWPQVIEIIANSRRPVIMTCNDLNLIPFEKLPLQTTLLFHPPAAPLLTAYLSKIASLESQPPSRPSNSARAFDSARALRGATYRPATDLVLQIPLCPGFLREERGGDLRMGMSGMQVGFAGVMDEGGDELEPGLGERERERGWEEMRRAVEGRSVVDLYLSSSSSRTLEVIEPDTYRRTGDDEDHPHPLMKPVPRAEGPGLAGYTREEEIGRSVWVGSGNGGEVEDEEAWVVRGLKGRREDFMRKTLPFLDPIIPLDSHLLPNPVLFTTYIPYISIMVAIDDRLERLDAMDAAEGRPRKNRKTGRVIRLSSVMGSGRAGSYVRQMRGTEEMGEIGLGAVRECRLDMERFEVPVER